jgi:hypothetical protein
MGFIWVDATPARLRWHDKIAADECLARRFDAIVRAFHLDKPVQAHWSP